MSPPQIPACIKSRSLLLSRGDGRKAGIYYQHAFVLGIYSGLTIVDISDPSNPVAVGRLLIQDAADVFVSGSYAFIANKSGLSMVDVADPAAPIEVKVFPITGRASGVFVSGNLAFVNGSRSVLIIDTGFSAIAPAQ